MKLRTPLSLAVVGASLVSTSCIEVAAPELLQRGADVGQGGLGGDGSGGEGGPGGAGGEGSGTGVPALPVCGATVSEPCATVLELDAGRRSTCARLDDGTVRCWGGNDGGQLGLITRPATAFEPPTVTDLPSFDELVLGDSHGCGRAGSSVSCWGYNVVMQLGDEGPSSPEATSVSLGQVTRLASWGNTTCALGAGLTCWGFEINGQAGNPKALGGTFTGPDVVSSLAGATILDVGLGAEHACVLLPGDEVRCWGNGQAGRLGTGDESSQPTPVPVQATYPTPVHRLLVGDEFGCVLAGEPAAAYCWGYFGPFHWHDVPTLYSGWIDAPVRDIALGFRLMCVAYEDGTVRCAGSNGSGQIPLALPDSQEDELLLVPDVTGTSQLAIGRWHVCALSEEGDVTCWGRNASGQLGRQAISLEEPPGPVVWERP